MVFTRKGWVAKLATDLRNNGVEAVLDTWDCQIGTDLTLYIERGIREADRVLLICTPTYREKANKGEGGVGYERLVVTAELARNVNTEKFICVLRDGSDDEAIPSFAGSRLFLDLRDDEKYQEDFEQLLRALHYAPASPKPPVGPNPFLEESPRIHFSGPSSAQPVEEKPPLGPNPFVQRIVERIVERPVRRRLPDIRRSITHRFNVAGYEGYLTVGIYRDGSPGELFITMSKQGSTLGGVMNALALSVSLGLQYGIPLEVIVKKFEYTRFEPMGVTARALQLNA